MEYDKHEQIILEYIRQLIHETFFPDLFEIKPSENPKVQSYLNIKAKIKEFYNMDGEDAIKNLFIIKSNDRYEINNDITYPNLINYENIGNTLFNYEKYKIISKPFLEKLEKNKSKSFFKYKHWIFFCDTFMRMWGYIAVTFNNDKEKLAIYNRYMIMYRSTLLMFFIFESFFSKIDKDIFTYIALYFEGLTIGAEIPNYPSTQRELYDYKTEIFDEEYKVFLKSLQPDDLKKINSFKPAITLPGYKPEEEYIEVNYDIGNNDDDSEKKSGGYTKRRKVYTKRRKVYTKRRKVYTKRRKVYTKRRKLTKI